MTRSKFLFFILAFAVFEGYASAPSPTNEEKTAHYLETIRYSSPERLQQFFLALPKGADLHNHIVGATYAENLIRYSIGKAFCIDTIHYVAQAGTGCDPYFSIDNLPGNLPVRDTTIDTWSMRNFNYHTGFGHDHFFATFGKFAQLTKSSYPQILAEIINRAGYQNTLYLELMDTFDAALAGDLGTKLGWSRDFNRMYQKIMHSGQMPVIVNTVHQELTTNTKAARHLMACETFQAQPGCNVTVNYLYHVLRAQAPERVFAQFVLGFELANKLPEVVGFNLVQAEDNPIALRDYVLQMQMIQFLRTKYPDTKISLHAGELNARLAPPADRTFHIRSAVEVAGANRIGHGVDIMQETLFQNLLQKMATNKILVEINLTSNQSILGVDKTTHPFLTYLAWQVPTTLSTDDEGILRTNLTEQYIKATQDYKLPYRIVKNLSRNGLEYGFLAGASLWIDNGGYKIVHPHCAHDYIADTAPGSACQHFLNENKKANLQWNLEKNFAAFEKQMAG